MKVIEKVNMICSICGEKHEVDLCEEVVESIVKKVNVKHIEHYYKCNKYEDENTFMTGDMWNESLINSLDAYREKHDLLTSKEIKEIRNKYNITQAELAFALGLGEVTITRYETNQIQEISNDNILKEINNNAIFFLKLLEKNKSKFSDKRFNIISNHVKEIIDKETLLYLNEQKIIGKYINYNEENILNGNCILDIEKLNNVLAYIAKKMVEVKKVVLMKLLWYIDAVSFSRSNKAITGLVYTHMTYGALPIAYNELLEMRSIKYEEIVSNDEYFEYKIYYNPKFKIVGLSKEEKVIIDTVINKFKNYKSGEIAEYMHNEKAYVETKQNEIISFDLVKELKEF